MNKQKFNIWNDYEYPLKGQLLSPNTITIALDLLHKNLEGITAETTIFIQFKIKIEQEWRSVSYLQTIELKNFMDLKEIFIEYLDLRDQDYILSNPNAIIFTYKLVNSGSIKPRINRARNITETEESKTFSWKGHNLPRTMDFTQWGKVLFMSDTRAQVQKTNSHSIYDIEILDKELKVTLKIKDRVILEFRDIIIEKGKLGSFERILNNHRYTFIDEVCVFKTIKKETKFLKSIEETPFINNNFITMDLETRTIDNIMSPYAVSIYDGTELKSLYLTDYANSDAMLKEAINYIMKPKYNNSKVYLHNFSFFDGIFLVRILSELSSTNIKPIIRDGRIIDLKFSFKAYENKNLTHLYFRDSYLLLPSSLEKLAINFKVETKGVFPYEFVNNKNISLDYKGSIPNKKFYSEISELEYSKLKSLGLWDLRLETLRYCEQDVRTLHQIITEFQKKIFRLFRVDVLKYPTLSSLAFGIYRSKFLGESKIPLIDGNVFNYLKKGYTGGSVDVYKPYGKNIYRYDVNSLYPYVMRNFPMPVGNPIYFEGDLEFLENNYNLIDRPFGFFEVEVEAPKNLHIPILQTRIKTSNGTKTVAPVGSWIGIYFSEEINNARGHGYKFKILNGYLFERGSIFKDYVDFLYELKVNSEPATPDYIIAKLLLNSLYGRFGMNPHVENHLIIDSKDVLSFEGTITNVLDLKNGKELISFFDDRNWSEESKKSLNISISISAAVTASARVHMSKFKTMTDYTIYYTDTDSIDINKPLPEEFIGRELGLMKLEHVFKEAIFLAPKVYGGVTENYEYVKVKGLKNPISYSQLKPLLYKNTNLEIAQDKWYRSIANGHITIREEVYTLMINNTKRTLMYDTTNKFYDTKPLCLNTKS